MLWSFYALGLLLLLQIITGESNKICEIRKNDGANIDRNGTALNVENLFGQWFMTYNQLMIIRKNNRVNLLIYNITLNIESSKRILANISSKLVENDALKSLFDQTMTIDVDLDDFNESLFVENAADYEKEAKLSSLDLRTETLEGLAYIKENILSYQDHDCKLMMGSILFNNAINLINTSSNINCIDENSKNFLPGLNLPKMLKILRINAFGELTIGRLNFQDYYEPQVNALSGWIFTRQPQQYIISDPPLNDFASIFSHIYQSKYCEMGPHDVYITRVLHFNQENGWELLQTNYKDADCTLPEYSMLLQGIYNSEKADEFASGHIFHVNFKYLKIFIEPLSESFADLLTHQSKTFNEICGSSWTWEKGVSQDISVTNGCRFLSLQTPNEINQLLIIGKDNIRLFSYPENTMNLSDNPLILCLKKEDSNYSLITKSTPQDVDLHVRDLETNSISSSLDVSNSQRNLLQISKIDLFLVPIFWMISY